MSSITTVCISCGSKIRAANSMAGKTAPCPKCKAIVSFGDIEPRPAPASSRSGTQPTAPLDGLFDGTDIGDDLFAATNRSAPPQEPPAIDDASAASFTSQTHQAVRRGGVREAVDFSRPDTTMGDRYYLTYWFVDARGLAEKYLGILDECIASANFPDIRVTPVTVTNGSPAGCLNFLHRRWEFNALAIWSTKDQLSHSRCIYKATEFGNVLHLSLLFYTHSSAGCSRLVAGAQGGLGDINLSEYEEAFQRFIWMAVRAAVERLAVTPIKSQEDERRQRDFTSTLKALVKR